MSSSNIHYVGSRDLHRDLRKILADLEDPDSRYVLTIHSRPKAVMIGVDAFLELLQGHGAADRLLALQLSALVRGRETSRSEAEDVEAETEDADALASVAS